MTIILGLLIGFFACDIGRWLLLAYLYCKHAPIAYKTIHSEKQKESTIKDWHDTTKKKVKEDLKFNYKSCYTYSEIPFLNILIVLFRIFIDLLKQINKTINLIKNKIGKIKI